ncbi:MAG TPA: cysteine-rich CWC family protein [Xanthobacteraceae bacterium]
MAWMKAPPRLVVCENCGGEFGCSRDDIGECWCAKESYRLPLPPETTRFKDCLCPQCLRKVETQSAAKKAAPAS